MAKQSLTTEQTIATTISQQQVRFVRMVELTAPEVEEAVQKELEENPALEATDSESDTESQSATLPLPSPSIKLPAKNYEFFDKAPSSPTLSDFLSRQLGTRSISPDVERAAGYIIGNLDSNGYLSRNLQSIANDIYMADGIDLSSETMTEALSLIQSLDPAGVGARTLQECLSLQIARQIAITTPDSPRRSILSAASAIIASHLNSLSLHHYDTIARQLRLSREDTEQAIDIIKRLNPKPGAPFGGTPQEWNRIIPDFIITISQEGNINISLNNAIPDLAISRTFEEAVQAMTASRNATKMKKTPRQGKEYILDRYNNAREFIKVLARRQETLFNVMTAIADIQKDYLLTEDESKLRPMGLKDVAKATGYNLSLISRSTSNKHVALPWGIFPLRFFFSETFGTSTSDQSVSGRSVENAIRKLIEQEDKRHPLSDDAITRHLTAKGLEVSRRTVNKYRDRLNIPPARLRKLR